MKSGFKKIFNFEPINITQIILYVIIIGILLIFFKTQFAAFFDTLKDRPITITMKPTETSVRLDAPVVPQLTVNSITDPTRSPESFSHWENILDDIRDPETFRKMDIGQLFRDLENMDPGEVGVLNFEVNDPDRPYYRDPNMLKYLSVAAEKIRYLAFYDDAQFVGYIRIEMVIKGLSAGEDAFSYFGDKLKHGDWAYFPGLITVDQAFTKIPTIRNLYERLKDDQYSEIPFVQDNKLRAILNYETIADGLYQQTIEMEENATEV